MASRRRPLAIAHRGASGECPENTRAAFVKAVELGADMIEIDCQLTRDGAAVILHDETLERTTTGRGPVRDRTLREIRALDAGSWFAPAFAGERLPTLEETIEILRGKTSLNLELKGDDEPGRLELHCLGILASYGYLGDTVFSSFSTRRMRVLRDCSPAARIGILVESARQWTSGLVLAAELAAEAVHPELSFVRPALVAEAHERGLEVRVWSVNRPKDIERLAAWGVDAIFTDHPERVLRVQRAHGAPSLQT